MQQNRSIPLSRRSFLRLSAYTLGGSLAAGGLLTSGLITGGLLSGCGPRQVPADDPQHYYSDHRSAILDDLRQMLTALESVCAEAYGSQEAAEILAETNQEFERLLPELPYIGGGRNDLTANLYQSALALPLYRSLQNRSRSAEETGRILYETVQKMMHTEPMLNLAGRATFSQLAYEKMQAEAEESQKRTYPGDWVFEFVPGDGQTFEFGIDYTECGICKYYAAQGAAELTPYLCMLDFPMSAAMNTGLERTNTLAQGASRCDFRYKFGRPIRMG